MTYFDHIQNEKESLRLMGLEPTLLMHELSATKRIIEDKRGHENFRLLVPMSFLTVRE